MTPDDLRRIHASTRWRERRIEVFHDTSLGSVLVKGQRPPRGPLRYSVLNGAARLVGLPMLRAAPALGGAASQRVEVDRLRALAAAGVWVPEVLHVDEQFFVQRFIQGPLLFERLRDGGAPALLWWQRGAGMLVELHASQQYLSQAFTRNIIAAGEQLAMIDFEDDPLQVMPLVQAQARDWLAYLYTSAMTPPGPEADMAEILRSALADEPRAVRHELHTAAARLAGLLPRRRHDAARGWRRSLSMRQSTVALLLAAAAPASPKDQQTETPHARHH
jgi:hypothetical protein